jgi:uncharacterized UBP type Zn finger protein
MGFDLQLCKKALKKCDNDVQKASELILTQPEKLLCETPMDIDPVTNAFAPAIESPSSYKLSSFITHLGTSVGTGHYVAHVLKD